MAANPMDIRIVGINGLPEVHPGDDLAALILAAAAQAREKGAADHPDRLAQGERR